MASIYKREKLVQGRTALASPFWWIKFFDPHNPKLDKHGKLIPERKPTNFRIGNGPDKRRAEALEAEYTLRERQFKPTGRQGAWDEWVMPYFELRYTKGSSTYERAKSSWQSLRQFLFQKLITHPGQFTREHCFAYMTWRKAPDKKNGKYRAKHNTALLDLKFMRVIMREAVARHYAAVNPCVELGIKREDSKRKPSLPADICTLIREKISETTDPILKEMFHHSFEIAYHHGVRLSATWLNPLEDVWHDEEGWKIRFTQKGKKISVKFLHPNLIPMFEKLRAEKRTQTYQKPPYRQWMGAKWFKFFRLHKIKSKLPGASFHCTRVTVATTLALRGVDQRLAMEYVDHASTTVHAVYLDLKPQDSSKVCHDAIK